MGRARRLDAHAAQCERDQHDDDQRVEHDGREDRALRALQLHEVEHAQLRVDHGEQRRQDGKVLRHVVGDGERGQRTAGDQQLLAHRPRPATWSGRCPDRPYCRLARGLGAVVHGHADISLGQGGGIVGAVPAHGHQTAVVLFLADARQLLLRRGLGQHIVDPASAAMAAAVSGLSPVTITVRIPSLRSSAKRSRMPGLTTSLRWITPSKRLSMHTSSGVPPLWAIRSTSRASGVGISRRCRPTKANTASTAPLR